MEKFEHKRTLNKLHFERSPCLLVKLTLKAKESSKKAIVDHMREGSIAHPSRYEQRGESG